MKSSKRSAGQTLDGTSLLFDEVTAHRLFHGQPREGDARSATSTRKPSKRRFLSAFRRGADAGVAED